MSPGRRLAFTLVTLIAAAVAIDGLAGLGEIVAYGTLHANGRPMGLYEPGPGHPRLKAGAHLPGLLYSIHVNSLGFRGPEIAAAKPTNGLRIWCVGGSTTFDIYAPDDASTWPARLGAEVAKALPDRAVEVINAGVPGEVMDGATNTLLQSGPSLEPDYVVIYAGPNDIRGVLPPTPAGRGSGPDLAIFRFLDRVRPAAPATSDNAIFGRAQVERLRDIVSRLVRTVRDLGAKPVLATHALRASPDATGDALRDQIAETSGLLGLTPASARDAFAQYNAMISEMARTEGFPFADVRAAVPSGAGADTYWGDATHFRSPGSEIAAHTVAGAILADVAPG